MLVSGEKHRKRSYLLPGTEGRAHRRKKKLILKYSILFGLGVAVIMATLMYWINRLGP